MNDIRCVYPWTAITCLDDPKIKNTLVCCRELTSGSFFDGDLKKWRNSDQAKYIRKNMLEGTITDTLCRRECFHLLGDWQSLTRWKNTIKTDFYKDDENANLCINEISDGKIELDSLPFYISVVTDHICNFDCIMCLTKKDPCFFMSKNHISLVDEIARNIRGKLELIILGGEPMVSQHTLELIDHWKQFKNIHFGFITNCSTFKSRIIENNNIRSITISMDSPYKETFEKIRLNSKFEIVEENLHKYIEWSKKKNFRVNIIFTVTSMNYFQIEDMIKYISKLGNSISLELNAVGEVWDDPLNIIQQASENEQIQIDFLKVISNAKKLPELQIIRDHELTEIQLDNFIRRLNFIAPIYWNRSMKKKLISKFKV